jgi:cytochrome c553
MILVAAAALTAGVVTASAADVKENWANKKCKSCHGPDGTGDTKLGKSVGVKDFTDAKYQASMKDEDMFKAIKEGIKDGEKTRMKAAEGLSDEEIKALAAYVRTFKK